MGPLRCEGKVLTTPFSLTEKKKRGQLSHTTRLGEFSNRLGELIILHRGEGGWY